MFVTDAQMPAETILVQKNAVTILFFYWTRQLFDDNSSASFKNISTHSTGEVLKKKCLKIISIERPTGGAKYPSSDFCVGLLKHNEKEHNEKDNDKT